MIRHLRKVPAVAFGLSAVGATIQTALGRDTNRYGLPDMSMPALTATLALATKPGRTRDAATVALLAGTAGDMSSSLTFKIGWFALGHISYIAAFASSDKLSLAPKVTQCRRWWPIGAAILVAGVWASARAEGLRPACVLYACLVAAMTVTASGYSRLAGASALMFALSDFLIGFGMWRAKRQTAWGRALIVSTYLLAQAGLTAAVIKEEGK